MTQKGATVTVEYPKAPGPTKVKTLGKVTNVRDDGTIDVEITVQTRIRGVLTPKTTTLTRVKPWSPNAALPWFSDDQDQGTSPQAGGAEADDDDEAADLSSMTVSELEALYLEITEEPAPKSWNKAKLVEKLEGMFSEEQG